MRRFLFLTYVCFLLTAVAEAQAPTPAFSATPVAGCSPLVVKFKDNSTGNPTTWFWDFGNGATSTLQEPSTTYFLPGTYTVTLKVTNTNGSNSLTLSNYITVYGKPEANLTASDSVGCFPFDVQFTDLSKASSGTTNTSWTWDFGDGTQSTGQFPKTTYQYSGNYTVSLKVTNDKGCWSTATKLNYINVPGGAKAAFRFSKMASCTAPFTVNFTNASTGSGTLTYTWDFGDGTTSSDPNPSHVYNKEGLYSIRLIVQSSNGCRDTLYQKDLLDLRKTTTSFTVPGPVCSGDTIVFTNTSSDSAYTTRWDFGDGTTSSALSPVKSFASPGTYTVKLVQSYGACMDSIAKTLQVVTGPTAGFTTSQKESCQAPLTVTFQNTTTNAVNYVWDFGDGTTSTATSPTHTFTAYGNYTIKLVASNAAGCSDTLQRSSFVNVAKPSISFDSLPAKGCVPFTHTFHATINAYDPIVSYLWKFGDGGSSTDANPTYTYTEAGNFTVSLTVTTANGCQETYSLSNAVIAGWKPVVNFSSVPPEFCAFQAVPFSTYASDGTDWLWDFGDGSTSTDPLPQHLYSDTGTFSVTVVVENRGCKDTFDFPQKIHIKPPIARFSYKANCKIKPEVAFKDESVGATFWQWQFGDGTISYETNPVHRYPRSGTYTVQLMAGNSTCFHVTQKTVRIASDEKPDFTALPTSLCRGDTVAFKVSAKDTTNIVGYAWDFGSGKQQGAGMETTFAYPKPGLYTVSLFALDVNGCIDTITKPKLVKVNGPAPTFSISSVASCKGLHTTFTDASKSDGVSKLVRWQWDFGDGSSVTNTAPTPVQHLYTNVDTLTATLFVTDAGGCWDSTSQQVIVRKTGMVVDFVSADTLSCPGAGIHFSNRSQSAAPFTSNWSFGDGTSSTGDNPVALYKSDGQYNVTLRIRDNFGCTDSVTKNAYIAIKSPVASFSVSNTASSCLPFKVQYTNTSTNYIAHVWDLNGGTSEIPNPTQYYTEPGVYQTRLIVTSPGGCTDTATKDITVYSPAQSSISYLPLDGCKPLKVDVQAHSPNRMNYVWDFGDGTIISGTDTAVLHVYNSFGDFVPKVIMEDSAGCVIPITGLDTIRIIGVTAKFGLDQPLLCDRGMVNLTDSTIFNDPVKTYNWSFGDGATSTQTSPSHWYARPGKYNISLNVVTENHCVDTFSLPMQVVASPVVRIGGDTVVCVGDGLLQYGMFDQPDTSVVRWSWLFPNGKTSSLRLPLQQVYKTAGSYTVQAIATNSSGCKDTSYQNILVNPLPSVTLPAVITTKQATPVLIPAVYSDDMKSYAWNSPEGLSCTTCPQPMANPKLNTKYNVTFVDRNGCRNTGEVQVIVLCNNDNVFVPNTFSPNGDGSNDVFYVRGKGLSRVKSLRIFNRWGELVFEQTNFNVNDASKGWNGTAKGARPVPGVYVYQVEIFCDNSQVVKFEGNVALIQ